MYVGICGKECTDSNKGLHVSVSYMILRYVTYIDTDTSYRIHTYVKQYIQIPKYNVKCVLSDVLKYIASVWICVKIQTIPPPTPQPSKFIVVSDRGGHKECFSVCTTIILEYEYVPVVADSHWVLSTPAALGGWFGSSLHLSQPNGHICRMEARGSSKSFWTFETNH